MQFRQCLGFDPNILNYATRREPHSKRYGKSRDRGQLIGVIAIEVGATVPVVDLERPHKTHSGFMRLCRHCPDSLLRRMGLVSGPKMLEQSLSPEDDRLVEARGGIDAHRPCRHTTIPIDEYPCNLLMLN